MNSPTPVQARLHGWWIPLRAILLFVGVNILLILAAQCAFRADGRVAATGASGTVAAASPGGTQKTGCSTPAKPGLSAAGAGVVPGTAESLAHRNWQRMDGEIAFTVRSFVAIPADATVFTCFRWTSDEDRPFIEGRSRPRLDLSGDGKTLTVTTKVPDLGPWPRTVETILALVPRAEVRILATDSEGVRADATETIGITYPLAAVLIALETFALGCLVVYQAGRRLFSERGPALALRIISMPSGYASLSQFQIVLWTFVVAISAVYVMSLSGELIQITDGTLVLLGIAGAAFIGAKIEDDRPGGRSPAPTAAPVPPRPPFATPAAPAGVPAPATPAVPAAPSLAPSPAPAPQRPPPARALAAPTPVLSLPAPAPSARRTPEWWDLIASDAEGTRDIDVSRFQMLFFTLITAVFVLISVFTASVIPEIPTGFQALMGISNGAYIGTKVANARTSRTP